MSVVTTILSGCNRTLKGLAIPPTHLIYHHPVINQTFFLVLSSDTIHLSLLLIDSPFPSRHSHGPLRWAFLIDPLFYSEIDLSYNPVVTEFDEAIVALLPCVHLLWTDT